MTATDPEGVARDLDGRSEVVTGGLDRVLGPVVVHDRLETAELLLGDHGQPGERRQHGEKDTDVEQGDAVHPSPPVVSTIGWKSVGP